MQTLVDNAAIGHGVDHEEIGILYEVLVLMRGWCSEMRCGDMVVYSLV